ncbi:unnamed protein product [Cyclocybe aegerita]|uniref:Uncharacterized protein n=1 Tax=Cyclocybe aegerita TaxID=1973307 RepID=A0A8S0XLY7_CYCAE|nr:unnamed protein product [Cyclocybe aegerita]
MIIIEDDQLDTKLAKEREAAARYASSNPAASSSSSTAPSTSGSAPPSQSPFATSSSNAGSAEPTEHDHLLVDFAQHGGGNGQGMTMAVIPDGPPPDFTPYQAEHFEVGYDDVVSHDPHLNTDGEALYRFLLAQSEIPPTYRMNCRGTHHETRQRWVTERDSEGRTRNRRETYTETVTDFDFNIDITPAQLTLALPHTLTSAVERRPAHIHWSVPDDEPAYRGRMVREYDEAPGLVVGGGERKGGKRTAKRKEVKAYKKWLERRERLGFPPWMREADEAAGMGTGVDGAMVAPPPEGDALRSSKTLRQWADEYCQSQKTLKEFVYHKVLYGWNIQQIENSVRATIQGAPYHGTIAISFTPHHSKIYIRPDNWVSRTLSNKWLKFLSILLCIYPFIWLFKRFHSRGGGRWEVCGGAYPLKQWVPLEAGEVAPDVGVEDLEGLPSYAAAAYGDSSLSTGGGLVVTRRSSRFMQTTTGPKKLVGLKEGEWFRSWEGVITRAVIGRYQSSVPIPRTNSEASALDGYNETLVRY